MAKSEWTGWKATIVRTRYGTWGIEWKDAPPMEARGGWSGPYLTPEDARTGVLQWCERWDLDPEKDITITVRDA